MIKYRKRFQASVHSGFFEERKQSNNLKVLSMEQISVVNANERQKAVVQLQRQRWYIELFLYSITPSHVVQIKYLNKFFRIEDALREIDFLLKNLLILFHCVAYAEIDYLNRYVQGRIIANERRAQSTDFSKACSKSRALLAHCTQAIFHFVSQKPHHPTADFFRAYDFTYSRFNLSCLAALWWRV